MFRKLAYFVSIIIAISSAVADEDTDSIPPEKLEVYKKIVGVLCQPNLPADKAAIVTECDALVPQPVHDVFHACIREVTSIKIIDMPIFCYKAGPDREKIGECLKGREEEAKAHGIVIDKKMKEEYRDKYMGCMGKSL